MADRFHGIICFFLWRLKWIIDENILELESFCRVALIAFTKIPISLVKMSIDDYHCNDKNGDDPVDDDCDEFSCVMISQLKHINLF